MVSLENVPPIDKHSRPEPEDSLFTDREAPRAPTGPTGEDTELLDGVRSGAAEAMAVLYERHREMGLVFARGLMSSRQEAEDVLQEAFVKAFSAIRNGYGPTDIFAAYLNTSIRSVANTFWKKYAREQPAPDEDLDTGPEEDPRLETVLALFEHERIALAMKSLPERWRTVLWHAEVMGWMPRDIGPLMGIEPNAVSALLIRARKGLRRAYELHPGTGTGGHSEDSAPALHVQDFRHPHGSRDDGPDGPDDPEASQPQPILRRP